LYRRYQADGVDGLQTRSRRPKTSPNATHVEIVGKIMTASSISSMKVARTSECRTPFA
jgi:hypothetical protein